MSEDNKYEKHPATAPPPYSVLYGSGDAQPPQTQVQPQPEYSPQQTYPGYLDYPQPQPVYTPPQPLITPQIVVTQPTVVVMEGCPTCTVGVLEDDYTCCGILWAISFFPIGILCCLAMKEKRCTNCHASF